MSRILADSSVWIDFFRQANSEPGGALSELVKEGLVCTTGLVTAEVLSGSRSQREFRRLEGMFKSLPMVEEPSDLWPRLAKARYQLARKGFQASVADLIVAITASANEKQVFTLDRHFERISTVVPFEILRLPLH